MHTLFGTHEVRLEDIASLEGATDLFLGWATHSFAKNNKLSTLASVLIWCGACRSVPEALTMLNEVSRSIELGRVKINAGDVEGASEAHMWRELVSILNPEGASEPSRSTIHRHLGIISHAAIPRFFNGEWLGEEVVNSWRMHKVPLRERDELLKVQHVLEQYELFGGSLVFGGASAEAFSQRPFGDFLHAVYDVAGEASLRVEEAASFSGRYYAGRAQYARLAELLALVFGNYVLQVVRLARGAYERHLCMLTLLSWARALLFHCDAYVLKGIDRALIREVQVLHPACSFGGWRSDAVEVFLDGRPPDSDVVSAVREQALRSGFKSVGHALICMKEEFGSLVQVGVREWKFAVGDAGTSGGLVRTDVVRACAEHQRQVQRYIASILVDYHVLAARRGISPIWRRELVQDAKIYYFLPEEVCIHVVQMGPAEREDAFVRHVVGRLARARLRAQRRVLEEHLGRLALHEARRVRHKIPPPVPHTATLFDTGPRKRLQRILDYYEDKESQSTGA